MQYINHNYCKIINIRASYKQASSHKGILVLRNKANNSNWIYFTKLDKRNKERLKTKILIKMFKETKIETIASIRRLIKRI